MGIMPLQFKNGDTRQSLGIKGDETFTISGVEGGLTPRQDVTLTITRADGTTKQVTLLSRMDTADEVDYYRNGGILHYVLKQMAKGEAA
jgi:aconitate hydratase